MYLSLHSFLHAFIHFIHSFPSFPSFMSLHKYIYIYICPMFDVFVTPPDPLKLSQASKRCHQTLLDNFSRCETHLEPRCGVFSHETMADLPWFTHEIHGKFMGLSWEFMMNIALWSFTIAIENDHVLRWFTYQKWRFSIANCLLKWCWKTPKKRLVKSPWVRSDHWDEQVWTTKTISKTTWMMGISPDKIWLSMMW